MDSCVHSTGLAFSLALSVGGCSRSWPNDTGTGIAESPAGPSTDGNLPSVAGFSGNGVGGRSATPSTGVQRILFVGDSFTHGRYTPVRQYNSGGKADETLGSALVVDENYGQAGARAELEPGPWGGIPGIFAELGSETKVSYNVHLEAISATSLQKNFSIAAQIIAQPQWQAIVLQELSARPISSKLTLDPTSNPDNFCTSVQTIEQAVHAVAPLARIYLYETWPRADLAQALSGEPLSGEFSTKYAANLAALGDAYHDVYYLAARLDGQIEGVAPVGDAWIRAWNEGVSPSNPYAATPTGPLLWYGLNAVNNPPIRRSDYLHPSVYGAYLSGLVLFQQISGLDVRTLGPGEVAAKQLGISEILAVQLQRVAWESVTNASPKPLNGLVEACSLTEQH
jgi:hypothetical protein